MLVCVCVCVRVYVCVCVLLIIMDVKKLTVKKTSKIIKMKMKPL